MSWSKAKRLQLPPYSRVGPNEFLLLLAPAPRRRPIKQVVKASKPKVVDGGTFKWRSACRDRGDVGAASACCDHDACASSDSHGGSGSAALVGDGVYTPVIGAASTEENPIEGGRKAVFVVNNFHAVSTTFPKYFFRCNDYFFRAVAGVVARAVVQPLLTGEWFVRGAAGKHQCCNQYCYEVLHA